MANTAARPLMALRLDMSPAQRLTDESGETRLIYHVHGGRFEGERLSGDVLPVSGDWVIMKGDVITMDVRVHLRTDEGWAFQMCYETVSDLTDEESRMFAGRGRIGEGGKYFRVVPSFLTDVPELDWLHDLAVVGVGIRYSDRIEYDVFEEGPVEPTPSAKVVVLGAAG